MREFLRRIDRNGERYLMLVFYCFIVFVIVTEVVRRFVLDFSSLWGEEAARFAFIYLGWVGASYARQAARAHPLRLPDPCAAAARGRLRVPVLRAGDAGVRRASRCTGRCRPIADDDPLRRAGAGAAHPPGLVRGGGAARLRDDGACASCSRRCATSPTCAPGARPTPARCCSTEPGTRRTLVDPWRSRSASLFIVALLLLAVPFWVAIGLGTIALLLGTGALPLSLLGEALFQGVDSFALIAIPLFVLTGDVMVRSGLAYKLLDFAEATTGSMRSGFGTSTVLGCGFFACISGSDAADAAAIGRITMDRLVERGYPKPYACALVASGACTGILIPPSIAYIIIGLVLGISSATLFTRGDDPRGRSCC